MDEYKNILENFSFIYVDKQNNEKLIFKLDDKNVHYTVHFGTKSRILDVHKTIELPDNGKTYETIIRINHFTIKRLFFVLGDLIEIFKETYFSNKVSPSFLRHYNIFAQSVDEVDLINSNIMNFDKKKIKMKFNRNINLESSINFMQINKEMKAASYILWRVKKNNFFNVGLLFVILNSHGNKEFYFLTKKIQNNLSKLIFTKLIIALKSSGSMDKSLYSELNKFYSDKYNKYCINPIKFYGK